MQMVTSTDGGLTWGPVRDAGCSSGLGGQPVVQPNGNVIVPFSANGGAEYSLRSTDGGNTWGGCTLIASVDEHGVAGNMRTFSLPSAEVAGDGRVYVAWQDCRFRSGCPGNDIVYSSSLDGLSWSAVTRIPIDPTNSGADHFLPGIAVDKNTSGGSTHLAVGYYYFPVSNCTTTTCDLTVGFVSSLDGGATWTTGRRVAGADEGRLDREHQPGAHGRRLHLDLVHGRRQGASGLLLGEASRQQRDLFAYDRLSGSGSPPPPSTSRIRG